MIIEREGASPIYVDDAPPQPKKRQLSPLQQQRNSCVSGIMKGRTFGSRQERGQAFGQAVKDCARKYPKQ